MTEGESGTSPIPIAWSVSIAPVGGEVAIKAADTAAGASPRRAKSVAEQMSRARLSRPDTLPTGQPEHLRRPRRASGLRDRTARRVGR